MTGNVSLVMTVLGADRPGLVEALATVVADHQGNWVESRMAHLAGQFAGIIRVTVPGKNARNLRAALEALELTISVEEAGSTPVPSGRLLSLELLGHDRPGIVREVSHALAERDINVFELETECTSAPWSGEPLFKATARLVLPEGDSVEALREALESVAEHLSLEIDLIERRTTS